MSDEGRIPDPRHDRDPQEPEQPPAVEEPEERLPDEPVEDPPTGEPAWRDPESPHPRPLSRERERGAG